MEDGTGGSMTGCERPLLSEASGAYARFVKRAFVWLIAAFLLLDQTALAAVDRSFGKDGSVGLRMMLGHLGDGGDLVLRRDGRMLIAGHTLDDQYGETRFELRQFLANGRPDPSFSSDGRKVVRIGTPRAPEAPGDILLRRDGSALVVGVAFLRTRPAFAAIQLTSTGRLDDRFDGDGEALYGVPRLGWSGSAADAVPVGRGRVVLAGMTEGHVGLLRIKRSGALDRSFGDDGWAIHSVSANDTGWVTAAARQDDGRIVVVGGGDWLLIARYRRNGARDRSFGTNGEVELDFHLWNEEPYDVAQDVVIDEHGRIIVVGSVEDATNVFDVDMVVARLLPDGSLDQSFADRGVKIIRWRDGADELAHSVLLDGRGRIVVAGSVESAATRAADYAVCRLFPGGRLDRGFGNDGWLRADLSWRYPPISNDQVHQARIDSEGRVVVLGTAGGTLRAGLVRFRP